MNCCLVFVGEFKTFGCKGLGLSGCFLLVCVGGGCLFWLLLVGGKTTDL